MERASMKTTANCSLPYTSYGIPIPFDPSANFRINGRLSVGLHRVHTSPDEYPDPFKVTVRIPTIASGGGYCL